MALRNILLSLFVCLFVCSLVLFHCTEETQYCNIAAQTKFKARFEKHTSRNLNAQSPTDIVQIKLLTSNVVLNLTHKPKMKSMG